MLDHVYNQGKIPRAGAGLGFGQRLDTRPEMGHGHRPDDAGNRPPGNRPMTKTQTAVGQPPERAHGADRHAPASPPGNPDRGDPGIPALAPGEGGTTDSILDDPFHLAAWQAYLEVYAGTKQFPPDSETTRRRAYQLYEEALAEKNRSKQPNDSSAEGSGDGHL